MANPLVSICIPIFNGAKYLNEALNSAINQTYRPLEIIISDDASTDSSLQIAESFKTKTDIPISIFNHKPSGIGANWNYCVEKSSGEYIKFLFQDDLLSDDCIKKMMKCALLDGNISLVVCARNILFDKSSSLNPWVGKWLKNYSNLFEKWPIKIGAIHNGNDLLKLLHISTLNDNKFGEPSCTLIKRSHLQKVSAFDLSLKQLLDLEAWYRLIKNRKVFFINESIASFRLHENQESLRNNKSNHCEDRVFDDSVFEHCFDHLNIRTRTLLFLKIKHLYIFRVINFFLKKLKLYSN